MGASPVRGTILGGLGLFRTVVLGGLYPGPCLWELQSKVKGVRSRVAYLVVEVSSGCRNGNGNKRQERETRRGCIIMQVSAVSRSGKKTLSLINPKPLNP